MALLIGVLLSQGSGFNNRIPRRQGTIPKTHTKCRVSGFVQSTLSTRPSSIHEYSCDLVLRTCNRVI